MEMLAHSVVKRKDRIAQFEYHGGFGAGSVSFFANLMRSAVTLLEKALLDRREHSRNEFNHASRHGPGAIILAVTAFDLWLTEGITLLMLPSNEVRKKIDEDTLKKFRFLYQYFREQEPTRSEEKELDIVVLVRHEIVHHFWRPDHTLVPGWVEELQKRNLLMTSARKDADYWFTQKLGSYALAYWIFEVIEASAGATIGNSKKAAAEPRRGDLHHFQRYRTVCPPKQLAQFDALHPPLHP